MSVTSNEPHRYRDACFTSYLESPPVYNDKRITYLAFQQEECPSTGNLHWQGFAQSPDAKTVSAWRKALEIGNSHVEKRLGNAQQASDYCTSEEYDGKDKGQVPGTTKVFGKLKLINSEGKGKRNDLDKVKEALDAGADPDDLMEDSAHFGAFCRHGKFFREYAAHKKRRKKYSPPRVEVMHGPSGTGKTRNFYDQFIAMDYWTWNPGMKDWMDGYHGQRFVLFDEFRGQIPFGQLLGLLDGYPIRIPYKGGFAQWSPEVIHLTSPLPPEQWYSNLQGTDKLDQLMRRINSVIDTSDYSQTWCTDPPVTDPPDTRSPSSAVAIAQ